ncbi:uncharacterized protein LY89DRAFT_780274 [Mollisia scopiformis]|uniref:Rhodopsin domain-containing protein n=1 Tax=Mollisia scopiformis TaxID=149040 RepID=A0A194XGK4_MOLSC|nr:uncharacterized protein LY89DRAFT_780274 [Mollisia scopiformis]KUJ19298.1 hypothetical protein LY89DRAFT_780274 [Mollisia scopiformis]
MDPGYLDTTPVRPPPPGQTSNFINPVSRSYQLVAVIAVTFALVVLFIGFRLYFRLKVTKSFGADDWLCIVATILTLSYSALILKLLWKPGGGILGIHLWDVPLSHYIEYSKGSLADSVLIRITNTSIKVAFFVWYLRLFSVIKYVKIMVLVGMVTVITFCVAFITIDLVACCPWPSEHGGWLDPKMLSRCNKIAPNLVTSGAYFSVITDFYILFIPLHQVPGLNLSRNKKIGLSFIFLTGTLACAAGLTNLIIRQDKKIFDPADFSWTIVPVYATSIVEINVGLMCHSMPIVLFQFVTRLSHIGTSLSSWIRERRERRRSPAESSSNLAASADEDNPPPQLPEVPSGNNNLTGIRTFVQNIYRSGAQTSKREETVLPTFKEELTSVDPSYHHGLKSIRPTHIEDSRQTNNSRK